MKKFILSLTALFTVGTMAAFANTPVSVDPKAAANFKKEFSSAELVQWSQEGSYNKVSFVLGGNRAIAYFGQDGELIGSLRDLVYNQLPLKVMQALDKRFANAAIFDIRELNNADGIQYKVTVEKNEKKYSVTIAPDGSVGDVIKIRK